MSEKEYIEFVCNDLRIEKKMVINVTEFSKSLGISRDRARQMLYHLYYIKNGNEKLYLIKDIAILLWNSKCSSN